MTEKKSSKLQDELRVSASKFWLAGLGAVVSAQEEGSKLFEELIDKGRDVESKGRAQVEDELKDAKSRVKERVATVRQKVGDRVAEVGESVSDSFDERVSGVMGRLGVPTRDEIQTLAKKVEDLTAKLDELNNSR